MAAFNSLSKSSFSVYREAFKKKMNIIGNCESTVCDPL